MFYVLERPRNGRRGGRESMSRHLRAAVAALAVGMIGLVATAVPASAAPQSTAKTIHVDPGGSIQEALDAANPGDTVDVAPGTYAENLVISKDGIRLVGHDTTVVPPAEPSPIGVGILVADVDLSGGEFPPPINHVVNGVTLTGLTIDGQHTQDTGVFVFGASNTTLSNNVSLGNTGYGFFANTSSGTSFSNDVASGAGEAGFYVGDSPDANASLRNVESFDNLFGIFIRDAQGVRLTGVDSHDNCLGMLVLADAPGPAGDVDAHASSFSHNQKACPANEEEQSPPFSGIGVAISGGHDVRLTGNTISDNVPTGPTFISAGVAVAIGDSGTAPENISIHGNRMIGNIEDVFSDDSAVNLKASGNH
jgi:Right handed beta helix region